MICKECRDKEKKEEIVYGKGKLTDEGKLNKETIGEDRVAQPLMLDFKFHPFRAKESKMRKVCNS